MKSSINESYVLDILQRLLNTPSPSGYCQNIMKLVQEETVKLGYDFQYTNKGCGLITVPGQEEGYVIGLSAHVDTLGAMVRSIKASGKIRFTPVGGYMMGSLENEYCTIHTRDGREYDGTIQTTHPSVHVFADAREQKREEASMEIRIDERVNSKEDVLNLGIGVGDFISFNPRVEMKDSGYIKSRHLDDKASVAALFGMLEMFRREGLTPKFTLKILITTYEEVGHGAGYLPQDINELLAIDMGAIGDDLSCTEMDVSICAKDSSGPYDYVMVSKLIDLAKRNNLKYAVDIYPQYGSDASAALRGGNDIRAALIGPGVHASHGMERTHAEAIWGTVALIAAYVMEPAEAYQ